MGQNSKIEWTHHTFNPWRGCQKVSPGCEHCYAETMSKRNPSVLGKWGPNGTRVIAVESYWNQPLKWDREAKVSGERRRVFCASLADVFEDRPELASPRERLFQLISDTPNLDWLLLTKRPENIERLMWPAPTEADPCSVLGGGDYLPNVWLGTSVEDQERADERIPHLLEVPATVRFLSCEPLLGPIEFSDVSHRSDSIKQLGKPALAGIDWVIVGGESGADARPMCPGWARSIRDQCKAAGVAFHFKQWGEWTDYNHVGSDGWERTKERPLIGKLLSGPLVGREYATRYLQTATNPCMVRVGKHAAGRLLDGRTWDEFPSR